MNREEEIEAAVKSFLNYEDYLDSMLTKDDLTFLKDKEICHELLTLGYHSNKRVISKQDFERKKEELRKDIIEKSKKELKLYSDGVTCHGALMQALAKREESNVMGRISTIIFLRDTNDKREEVSAYIDYAHRLSTENWEPYFDGRKKLLPVETDISFYNWSKEQAFSTCSPNFGVLTDKDSCKLLFICKKDDYIMDVNPKGQRGDADEGFFRHDVHDPEYSQAVIFDHVVSRPVI
ncbi:cilia- and flagella-associated protein 299-like [Uloborus diversus]|uniref:cilia- and flagella-associated protein 299-like n=1 Tax=Uloborus diversus TaxID=327109 RepID=UPI0024094E7A|nr:cilia- and flagella-associated protein 299-like [Uloborus diversus]